MRRACKRLNPLLFIALIGMLSACAASYDSARFEPDFALGVAAYDKGKYSEAARYWQPLAARFDLAAMRNMGNLHRRGLGVAQDMQKALNYYEAAAKRGFHPAQYAAALIYLDKTTQFYDTKKAMRWLAVAARGKYQPAIAQINTMRGG